MSTKTAEKEDSRDMLAAVDPANWAYVNYFIEGLNRRGLHGTIIPSILLWSLPSFCQVSTTKFS